MRIKKIYACWIYVKDLNKSIDFYQAVGFEIKFIENEWVEFDLGETSFAILKRDESKGEMIPTKTRIMFETDNIESLYNELRNKNIKFIGEVINKPYGKLLTFEDPDGHWLEFFEKWEVVNLNTNLTKKKEASP